MASDLPSNSSRFLDQFEGIEPTQWESPEDVGRISIDNFVAARKLGRADKSRGSFRLSGSAASNNTARFDDTGSLMVVLQKLVSAVGASLWNQKSHRGPLSPEIRSLTRLRLAVSPLPGSVDLHVTPEASVSEELYPEGQVPLDETRELLVDQSVRSLVELLATALRDDAGEERAIAMVEDFGPRVASSLKGLADSLVAAHLGIDVAWQVPGRPGIRARVAEDDAARISALVSGRELDAEPITLQGILHTVSDIKKWDLETDEGQVVRLSGEDLSRRELSELRVGQYVVVEALMKIEVQPGGLERKTYSVQSVESFH